MKGVVVVTGGTSGIGFAVCRALLGAGYPVVVVGRDVEKCRAAVVALGTQGDGSVVLSALNTTEPSPCVPADLLQQREVLRAAREIAGAVERFGCGLHAIVNNAGCVCSRFMTTEEGFEQQFALNHLAGFLLTNELMPLVRRDNAAVIFSSSASHKMMRMNWGDLMFEKRYRPLFAYKQSKLCNLLLAYRLRELGVRACCVDPGLVRTDIGNKNTSGLVDFVWNLRKMRGVAPEVAAGIYLSLCEYGFSGIYYGLASPGRELDVGDVGYVRERRCSSQVNSANARRLFDVSLELCGEVLV